MFATSTSNATSNVMSNAANFVSNISRRVRENMHSAAQTSREVFDVLRSTETGRTALYGSLVSGGVYLGLQFLNRIRPIPSVHAIGLCYYLAMLGFSNYVLPKISELESDNEYLLNVNKLLNERYEHLIEDENLNDEICNNIQ